MTGFLLLIFGLYLLWDLIDIRLAGSSLWRKPALDGTLVTASFLVLAGIIFVVVLFARPPAILSNAILLIFLYAYRVAQDRWGNCGEIKAETVIIFITGRLRAWHWPWHSHRHDCASVLATTTVLIRCAPQARPAITPAMPGAW